MNLFDILFVLIAVAAAVGGYRLGLIARVTSWLGLSLGVVVGSLVLPWLLKQLDDADDTTIAFVAISTLVGAALIGQAVGLVLGSRVHMTLPTGNVRRADQSAGAVAGVVGTLIGLWLLLPTLGDIPGRTSEQARESVIARSVVDHFPAAPDTVQALRRLVGDDPFPSVFDSFQPAPDPGPPPASTGLTETTADRVAQSVVKIEGEACDRVQEGTGFFVSEQLIVTNAHVVAGEDDSTIELADGRTADATVVAFDPERDLAVLLTEASGSALPLAEAEAGDGGGVFGHPGGRPLEVSPFTVSEQITARGRDIYDRSATERQVLVLASDLEPGDSGSALIDPQGQVIGVAFAVAPDKPGVAYALAIEELQPLLDALPIGSLAAQDTGDCLV